MTRPAGSIPIRLLLITLPLAAMQTVPCVADPATVAVPSTTRVIRSDEASNDSTFTSTFTDRRAAMLPEAPLANAYRFTDAPGVAWPWSLLAGAWYNRPPDGPAQALAVTQVSGATRAGPAETPRTPQVPPAPESATIAASRAWADGFWLMMYLNAYNHRFGCPLGADYDHWMRSWKTDCNPGH